MKIIGIKKFTGVYQDKAWEHYKVYCEKSYDVQFGSEIETYKVKCDVLERIATSRVVGPISSLIGYSFNEVYFDSYRNVVDFV